MLGRFSAQPLFKVEVRLRLDVCRASSSGKELPTTMLPRMTPREYNEEELRIMDEERERLDALNQEQADIWQRDEDIKEIRGVLGAAGVIGFTFGDLKTVEFPYRPTLLANGETPILRSGQLAQVFAERGVGKTWFTRTLALVMASGGKALGFHAPFPSRVLYLDGEMASEDIQKRDRLLAEVLNLPCDWDTHNLVTVANDWQGEPMPRVDTPQGQAAIESVVEWADIVIVDNRACLFDPEGEKDIDKWTPAQEWLLSLRRRGKAVIMVHHGNRQGGA